MSRRFPVSPRRTAAALAFAAAVWLAPPAAAQMTPFQIAFARGEAALERGDLAVAERETIRVLERDPASIDAWTLRARWAHAADRPDERVHALHRRLGIAIAQGLPRAEILALRAELEAADPLATELLGLRDVYVAQLLPLAEAYEKQARRHSAIGVHRMILRLDPERVASQQAIERIAAAPDPSLASDAKPKDLLEGISAEWIADFDRRHSRWQDRARLEKPNYVTQTNAGYAVMVRAAEAMEQMSAFYRQFFDYGTDGRSVGRIDLLIFRTRDEYMRHGSGPPASWSGGQFTGGTVETFIGPGGVQDMFGTLFHEAAHHFVSMATSASGWLNEGLASFFEGCRLLPNGTVQMNLPANHYLFALAQRMEAGWMARHDDGITSDPNTVPRTAPTFRQIVENQYTWGPAWYAPTWGVVYFIYNYQHPVDGRYIYRPSFRQFVNRSGGRVGTGAIKNFEETVLANPTPPTPGVSLGSAAFVLPKTIDELNDVWKAWILALRDEQSGRTEVDRPWHTWAKYAVQRKEIDVAAEHFEKGLVATPNDIPLLLDFADFLIDHKKESDRAVRLLTTAAALAEREDVPDNALIARIDRQLLKADPSRRSLDKIQTALRASARSLMERYFDAGLDLMTMQLAGEIGREFSVPGASELYARAIARSGKTLAMWRLAYNELDLSGWTTSGQETWKPRGEMLESAFGSYLPDTFDYQFLTLDTITSGDYSLEAEVRAERGNVSFAGLVFGRKGANTCHAYILFPPRGRDGAADTGFIDLTTFYGAGNFKVWRHTPVGGARATEDGTVATSSWHKLRVDVVGSVVDLWFDDEFVASQDFQALDVLGGSFGLVTGLGTAAFRNVRFLARERADTGAALERERRIAELEASGAPPGGSYQGRVPPWPEKVTWVQVPGETPPRSFADLGAVPKLIVLFSIEQNDLMPLHTWLSDLAKRSADVGLVVLSIASAQDADKLEEYLGRRRFPGLVGVDAFGQGFGIGHAFTAYSIDRFNLPRLLLLAPDDRVVWEGDPGFSIGARWKPGEATYLDDPLASLVERDQLRVLVPWRRRWAEIGLPALAEGRFSDALPILRESRDLSPRRDAAVADAQGRLAAVESAASSWAATGERLVELGAGPALSTLMAWGEMLGVKPPDPRARRDNKALLEGAAVAGYGRALDKLAKLPENARRRRPADPLPIADELAALGSPIADELAAEIRALGDSPTPEAIEAIVARGRELPARWLAREFFRW